MNRVFCLMACALSLASGCAPKEYDSTGNRDRGGGTAKRVNRTPENRQATRDQLIEKSKETWDLARELAAQNCDEFIAEAKQRLAEMDRQQSVTCFF